MMEYFLRKRLNSSQAKDDPRTSKNGLASYNEGQSATSVVHPPRENTDAVANDNLATAPPPPTSLNVSGAGAASLSNRASPPMPFLDRYKRHIPARLDPSMAATAQTSVKASMNAAKGSLATDGHEHEVSPESMTTSEPLAIVNSLSRADDADEGWIQTPGADLSADDMPIIGESHGPLHAHRNEAVDDTEALLPLRSTRSRRTMKDCSATVESILRQKNRAVSTGAAATGTPLTNKSGRLAIPLREKIRDCNSPRTPSPREKEKMKPSDGSNKVPSTATNDPPQSNPKESSLRRHTSSLKTENRGTSGSRWRSRPNASNHDKLNPEKSNPDKSKPSSCADDDFSVIVSPPRYDPTKSNSAQWESQDSSTSRPSFEWKCSKRWNCCRCGGFTIVEQKICARIRCQHLRCAVGCVMASIDSLGPNSGYGTI